MRASNGGRAGIWGKLFVLVLGCAVGASHAQTLTWDASGATPGTPADGSGTWNTTSAANWSNGASDSTWINGSTATIGANGGAAGTITIDDPSVSAAGINFNPASSGNYTIAASGSGALSLTGPITLSGNVSPTITAPIAAGNAQNIAGTGTMNLVIAPATTLSVSGNGTLPGLNATTNAAFIVGSPNVTAIVTTKFIATGGGSLVVSGGANNASFLVGVGNSNTSANVETTTVDLSGLSNFSFVTGASPVPASGGNEFAVGHGAGATSTMTLATNNTITAGTITVADNTQTPGLGSGSLLNAPNNPSVLNLGSGVNTLSANNIIIGGSRPQGTIQFAGTTGSVTIQGAGGAGTAADILLGDFVTGTPAGSASTLSLSGHTATVQAGTVILGQENGASGGTSATKGGSISFDTGTFNAVNLEFGVALTGTAGGSINGTFTLGSSANSTGTLNVTGNFFLADSVGGTTPSKGTFTLRGGTANISTNIIDPSTASTSTTILTLSGGTLNMNGFAIGTTSVASGGKRTIGTVTLPTLGNTAAIANLGGTGINNAGLTMNGTGVLVLEGNNNFTGPTTVSSGILQVGQAGDTVAPTQALPAAVTNNATVAFGSNQSFTNSSTITGAGGLTQNGTGATTLTGINSNTGPTTLVAGALNVNTLPNGGINGPIGASSNSAANLVFSGGSLRYSGTGTITDRLFSIAATGGSLDASGSGALVMGNTAANISADPAPRATTDSITTPKVTVANVNDLVVGMTVSGTNIPAGTTITAISKTANSLTLSNTPSAAGADTLSFGTAPRTFTLTGTSTANNTLAGTLSDSPAGGVLSVTKTGAGTWNLTANNTYTGGTTVSSGTLVPSLHALSSGGLTINGSTAVVATPTGLATALRLPALSITNGKLDLADNDLILDYTGPTPVATVAAYLKSGFANGAWTGSGIASSTAAGNTAQTTALGYADVTNTTFDGQSISGTAILVKYTYYGDNNLDGKVDTTDFQMFLDGLVATNASSWAQGDYTYDGAVDLGNDFNLFLTGYMQQAGALGDLATIIADDTSLSSTQRTQLLSAIPEPSTTALLIVASASLLPRRRKTN